MDLFLKPETLEEGLANSSLWVRSGQLNCILKKNRNIFYFLFIIFSFEIFQPYKNAENNNLMKLSMTSYMFLFVNNTLQV